MTNPKDVLSKPTHFHRAKSFRTGAALILAMLMLIVAGLTTVATAQTYTDLYNFDAPHGADPFMSLLAQGRDGNLYGTTVWGGTLDLGVVFRIKPSGARKVIYNFDGAHGYSPFGGVTLGMDGNFYGTTYYGGDQGSGAIFKVTQTGTMTTLYSFNNVNGYCFAAPIQSTDGNFYGANSGGYAYKTTSSGLFTSLGVLPGGGGSLTPLLQGIDGNFYGTTYSGEDSAGAVFKMTSKGSGTIVYYFDDAHGAHPLSPVIQGSDGNFYGTTNEGGNSHEGVVFQLTPQGAFTVLHDFGDPNFSNDGSFPYAGVVQATNGNFYGVTTGGGTLGRGVIFQITPAGLYSILYNFDGTHGEGAQSTPMQHTNGKLYGLTSYGGTRHKGVFYSLDLGLAPFVKTVPISGKVGKTIGILGGGLSGTSNVSFNGTAATFTVVSDTFLKAAVPGGATTGFVTVTTPGGTLKSNQEFRVKP